jgi:GNAT superfamily N-acetyltransferase
MNRADPSLELRPAGEEDILPLARLWALAFPGERSVSTRARQLQEGGTYGGLETCWVAEREGRMAGAFRVYDLLLHLHGRPLPTLGLAALAVDPSFRRQGVGAALCRAALRLGRERGDVLSALYPFRVDFYARLGYALTGEFHRYRFPPAALPAFPGAGSVRMIPPGERVSVVPDFYASLLPGMHGMARRTRAMWGFLEDEEETHVWGVSRPGGLGGYMVTECRPGRRGRKAALRVRELLAGDADSYRALLGWLSLQSRSVGGGHLRCRSGGAAPSGPLPSTAARKREHPRPLVSLGHPPPGPHAAGPPSPGGPGADGLLGRGGPGREGRRPPRELGALAGGCPGAAPAGPRPGPEDGALPIALVSGLLAEGDLPGVRPRGAPGISIPPWGFGIFRLLDVF